MKVIFTANAFTLDSDILRKFNVVQIIQKMQATGQKRYTDKKRSIYIELAESESFVEAKKETALYRAVGTDNEISKVALYNQFADYALTMVKNIPLSEYRPFLNVGNMTILEHKSSGMWHCMNKTITAKERYALTELTVFRRKWFTAFKIAIFERKMTFDNADTYYRFLEYLEK